jgi:hypothetical protein
MTSGSSTEDAVNAGSTSTAVPEHVTIDVEDVHRRSTDSFEIDV